MRVEVGEAGEEEGAGWVGGDPGRVGRFEVEERFFHLAFL